jgi:hypothetical protein
MTDELFEGAIIGEKRFPFVRVTESSQPRIVKKISKPNYRALIFNWFTRKKREQYIRLHPNAVMGDLVKEGLIYFSVYQSKREWKIIRSIAFQKSGLWKWLGIIPKELRCKNIEIRVAREVKKKLDAYLMETVKEQGAQSGSLISSQTENKDQK